jgi:phosphatidylglycerol:prolipoprotein diacylglycerol transferase
MHPVLFTIGSFVLDTYTVIWAAALALALAWTRNRAVRLYRLADEDARVALFWGFLGILVSARLGNILVEWKVYAVHPEKLLRPWEGGLSAVPAILGGGLSAWGVLRRRKIPVWPLAEAASLPAAALIGLGRLGCFLNGCCYGERTSVPWAVHFPFDPAGISRHPTELYESAGGVLLLSLLAWIESRLGSQGKGRPPVAVLWPLFLAGYGLIRLVVDPLRGDGVFDALPARAWGMGVFLIGALWLAFSLSRIMAARREGGQNR